MVQPLRLIVDVVVFLMTMYSPLSLVLVAGVSLPGVFTYTLVIMILGVAACAAPTGVSSAASTAAATVATRPTPKRFFDTERDPLDGQRNQRTISARHAARNPIFGPM